MKPTGQDRKACCISTFIEERKSDPSYKMSATRFEHDCKRTIYRSWLTCMIDCPLEGVYVSLGKNKNCLLLPIPMIHSVQLTINVVKWWLHTATFYQSAWHHQTLSLLIPSQWHVITITLPCDEICHRLVLIQSYKTVLKFSGLWLLMQHVCNTLAKEATGQPHDSQHAAAHTSAASCLPTSCCTEGGKAGGSTANNMQAYCWDQTPARISCNMLANNWGQCLCIISKWLRMAVAQEEVIN